ncbi:signal peptidase II Aspartic peptidase. MEROPS family A08 [Actinopolymorpha singaporensis]|uniref:Signal peptidase II Aspartic peptidase. MEROPS family A08 n=2 Tax=Actinopolymorpha singaporensis TaxID=117157 RepID=A0A1H1U1D8_9ACTN|nr:signal peptidase II Aspartic peptidase. MEROPS family A08 [Actinopolymorpha singaporensis]
MLQVAVAFLAAGAVAVCVDQLSKAVAGRLLAGRDLRRVAWRSALRWVLNHRGAVVALPVRWAILVWAAALACAGLLVVVHWSSLGIGGAVGLGLVTGGAAGNLVDRLVLGAVVDFIALRALLTFNFADAAMVAGAVVLVGSLA